MVQSTLLDDHADTGVRSYHSDMDSRVPTSTDLTAPPAAPQMPWPPYYPPAKPTQRWLPVAIIVGSIIIATAVISAVLLSRSPQTAAPAPGPAPSSTAPTSGQTGSMANTDTCKAWPGAAKAIKANPGLPAGWTWDTPNIDVYIANQNTGVGTALDLFEREISASDPAEITTAANTFIAVRRNQSLELTAHTYDAQDNTDTMAAKLRLDMLCGVTT